VSGPHPPATLDRSTGNLLYTGTVQTAQIASSEPVREGINAAYNPVADFLPVKLAAQVAGLSTLYVYRLVQRGVITRYGGWKITVSLGELLNRRKRFPRSPKREKQPRDAAGRYLPGLAWVTYDTTDGSVGCGAD
jgi:hypothetical protein